MATRTTPMEEHRDAHRRRALKAGKVVLSDWKVIDCLIRDISEGGARLEFGAPMDLPASFRVLITSLNLLVPAAPAWQRGVSVGVRFTGPGQAAPPRKF
ncbi:MAG: PilZ domain-containing protein [Propylenella sp.]